MQFTARDDELLQAKNGETSKSKNCWVEYWLKD